MFDPRAMVIRDGFDYVVKLSDGLSNAEAHAQTKVVDLPLRGIAHRVGAEVVDPSDTLCSNTACPAMDSEGNPFFMDESHLRASFVRSKFDALDRFVYLN